MLPIDLFHARARLSPDAVAVVHGPDALTYGQLHRRSLAVARGLQGLDPQFGSRVGICCLNHVDHLVAFLAVLAAGKVWVPLYPKNASAEVERGLTSTEASIVVADPTGEALVAGSGVEILRAGGTGSGTLQGLVAAHDGDAPRERLASLHETQAIKFTGGSTGAPKGVMQPYRAWNTNIVTQIMAWGLRAGDRCLAAAPITHGTSTYIMPTLATGGTLVLLDAPRPAEVLETLAEDAITTTFAPPTMIHTMMREPGAERLSFPALRNLIFGAAPMRAEEIVRAQRLFGPVLASTYGQTEAPQIATMISAAELEREDRRSSVGRATALTRVATLDEGGRALPPGEVGEIAIRGDLVMTGYWRQPEKTAEVLRDGWLMTGDLGSLDEEGFLSIKGRSKDVVISGGFNVYPADVEPVLARHPDVADCAVFGVPDEKWGEAVHAAVEWSGEGAPDPDAVRAWARAELGPVKAPKAVHVYERLPRNPYGKLRKQVLIDDALDRVGIDARSPE